MSRAYHVSNNGDDNNSGTRAAPFRTLSQINSIILQPSDRVFLERGSIFREDFRPQGKGNECGGLIAIKSYGSGPNPIVKGSDEITSTWDNVTANVYCTDQSFVGDICTRDCYLLKVNSPSVVASTPNSYYWDGSKLTVNYSGPLSDLENAVRTTPILYDNVEYMFHNGIDAGCTHRTGAGSLRAGFGLLVWQSQNVLISQTEVINAQKHGMGDANSRNVFWRDVHVGGCLGNNYGGASATALVSFTTQALPSVHYWRDAEVTWTAVDGSNNNNTFIAHGSGQDKLRVYRMKGPGVISFNKQTPSVQNWRAYHLEAERLFLIGDDMYVRNADMTSPDDARMRFQGNDNTVCLGTITGPSPFGNLRNFGTGNRLNGTAL